MWAVSLPRVSDSDYTITQWWFTWGLGAFWWPGFLSMMSLIAAWIRQWRPGDAAWTPREVDPDRVNRGAMAVGLVFYALAVAMMIAMPSITAQLPAPFPRIPYRESMLKYGNDKPDLCNPLVITDVTEAFRGSNFGVCPEVT